MAETKLPKQGDLPSNSHKAKVRVEDDSKKVNPVTKAVTQKKSLMKKLTEAFVGDDIDDVMGYIIWDVLIPAAKSTFLDMISGGAERLFYGSGAKQTRNISRDRNKSYVSYGSFSSNGPREATYSRNTKTNPEEIVLPTREDAELVLDLMVDLICKYGQVTVGDFCELVDMTSDYTDHKYGWIDLSESSVTSVRGGFKLRLPKPEVL